MKPRIVAEDTRALVCTNYLFCLNPEEMGKSGHESFRVTFNSQRGSQGTEPKSSKGANSICNCRNHSDG